MLSKDLTPNPKAVNIIRPSTNNYTFTPSHLFNYSSSTDSSSFSTASMNNNVPMMRQPSIESNPGLSFFCQSSSPNNNKKQPQQPQLFEKVQAQPPLVVSRINLSNFQQQQQQVKRPTVLLDDLENDDTITKLDDVDEDDDLDDLLDLDDKIGEETTVNNNNISSENMVRVSSTFKPGFGLMTGGLGAFMLRGNIQQQQQQPANIVDEARVNRKIEDLEIEKKSLLTLNQTLETVVKEQSNTISNLQDRLAAIERPLTPGLDTSLSKTGIMSSADIMESSDLERYLEDEDAAFERIKVMLLDLIEQAQSAVTLNKKVSGRVITDYDVNRVNNNSNMVISRRNNEVKVKPRPKSVIGDRTTTSRNSLVPNTQQQIRTATRRTSLGSMNSNVSSIISNSRLLSTSPTSTTKLSSSPNTSPIPHRRYSIQQRSPPALRKSESNCSIQSATSRTSKLSKQKSFQYDAPTTKKWLN